MPKLKKKSYSQKRWADQTRKWLGINVIAHGSSPEQTRANPPDRVNTGQSSQAVECDLTNAAEATHMNTATHSYHPDVPKQLIGDNNAEVPDDVIVAALELMKANCDADTSEYYGYYKPAAIHLLMNSSDTESVVRLPVNKNSIHIHPLTRHWVTSYFIASSRQLYVFDSKQSLLHLCEVRQQLLKIYDSDIANNLIYSKVTQQSFEPLCGVMAVAFAFTCFLGHNPSTVNYDISRARQHLKTCFETATVSTFPVTTNAESNWIYSYLAQQQMFRKCEQTKSLTSLQQKRKDFVRSELPSRCDVGNYSQMQKNTLGQKISAKVAGSGRLKSRIRKAETRAKRTKEQIAIDREKEKSGKAESRAKRTMEQIAIDREKQNSGKAESREKRTMEQIAIDRETAKSKMAKSRTRRTKEQIAIDREKEKSGKAESREKRNMEQIAIDRETAKSKMAKSRTRRTKEQIAIDREKENSGKAESREKRTMEQIAIDRETAKSKMAKSRTRRTKEQIEKDREKEKSGKAGSRETRTMEQIAIDRETAKSKMAKSRARRTKEHVAIDREKEKSGKAESREKRTMEQIAIDRETAKSKMAKSRTRRTKEHIAIDREKEKYTDPISVGNSLICIAHDR